MYDDSYNDYFIVCESTSPENNHAEILADGKKDGLNFLRFSTCLQDFNGPNRNRRIWLPSQIKTMSEDAPVQELIQKGSFVGEAGHPVPMDGKVTMERILTIDPLRTSHRIISLSWPKSNELHGIVETLDDGPGCPGNKMTRSILQGMIPAFSLRSLVPQRKEPDGTIRVLGPGRMICYDWIFVPSHKSAYMDEEIPVKNVIKKNDFVTVMESYTSFVVSHSDKIRTVVDSMEPAMEQATYDRKSGLMSIPTKEGRVIMAPENRYAREFREILKHF